MNPSVPATYREALQSMEDRKFLTTVRYRDQQWIADRSKLNPELLLFERLLIRRMKNIGVPMMTSEAMRSPKRQAELKAKGFSKLTNGPHMAGMAVDIVHSVRGWDLSPMAWKLIGHVGKEIAAQEGLKLTWGGDWKDPYDPAHWERTDWREIPSMVIPF